MSRFLTNQYITLRPVEIEDADFIWEVEGDSLQWIENSMMAPFSKENILQFALNYEADPFKAGQLRLIITNKENERLGIIDLFNISPQHRTAKIGIYIIPHYRSSGYASMAIPLLEEFSSSILNLRCLCAEVIEGNDKSISLFKKSGYSQAGILKDWIMSGNKTFSLFIFQKNIL